MTKLKHSTRVSRYRPRSKAIRILRTASMQRRRLSL